MISFTSSQRFILLILVTTSLLFAFMLAHNPGGIVMAQIAPGQLPLEERDNGRSTEAMQCPLNPAAAPTGGLLERSLRVNGDYYVTASVFPSDSGSVLMGTHDPDMVPNVTRLDLNGQVVSSHNLFDTGQAGILTFAQAALDEGYVISGFINPAGVGSGYVVKLNSDLDVQWSKFLPRVPLVVSPVQDGGYLVGSASLDTGNPGIRLVKLDSTGNLSWNKRIHPGSIFTQVYDVYEAAYLAGDERQCAGYLVYGAVRTASNDWDLYLVAISCDGNTILWQRQIGGSSWDGTENTTPRASRLVLVGEGDAHEFVIAATTNSFGAAGAVMLIPFSASVGPGGIGDPSFGTTRLLDGPGIDRLRGFGGPNFIRLADGNLLLGGSSQSFGAGSDDIFVVNLASDLSTIHWQSVYGLSGVESLRALAETATGIELVGPDTTRQSGIFLRLGADGSSNSSCYLQQTSAFTLSTVSPTITIPAYTIGDESISITDLATAVSDATIENICLGAFRQYLPIITRQ